MSEISFESGEKMDKEKDFFEFALNMLKQNIKIAELTYKAFEQKVKELNQKESQR